MKDWKTLSEEVVFENKYFNVVKKDFERHDGETGTYFVIEKQPSVFIVPVSDSGNICFIKQFRYPTKMWSLEIPAGGTDGENVLSAAQRELREETGFVAATWKKCGIFQVSPGLSSNIGHVFLAMDLSQTNSNEQHEEGIVECIELSQREILEKIKHGVITDGPTLAALTIANMKLLND